MAAAGGGKIRTRRYHIASKPYAKGNQSGLISRVTDTVKSIVPSWLQRYFRNGEAAEGGGVVPNSPTPPPNDGEAGGPLPDGRDSPEPSTSNAEPSTSRVALNFHDALSRPPLSRSHLNFGSLDGSPTFTQPSTSSAHLSGGPSSFSLVKEIKDTASQHEDDNISTTSGFSSRASDKDVTTTKVALLPVLWSPENERTHSGPPQAQSALKKPAFNLSVFGTSSSSLNSTTLNSSQLGDSPFYPGKTTYGGAAAVRTSARGRPGTPYQAPVRRQVKAKPAGAQPCGVTSATARRILLSLERMSSPLADAKRIPSTVSSPLSTSLDRADLDVSHIQLKRRKVDSPLPPVQKLLVPAASSVAGNRSMSFRPSLTPSGSLSRAMASRSNRDTLAGQLTIESNDASLAHPRSTSSFAYPLSSTPTANSMGSRGAGGKMKRERSVRPSSKRPDEESADVPELPAVSLPINTFTLPSFSFSSPPLTSSITPTTLANKVPAAASSPPCTPFTFSSPIVKATVSSTSSFSPSSGFTFSAPVAKAGLSEFNGKVETHLVTPVKPPSTTTASAPVSGEEFEGPFKPAKVLKQGSVLDLLKGPGFSSSPPTARSSPCLDKPLQALPSIHGGSAGFGDKFKPLPGSWNCGVCMLQNGPADGKCIACQTMRPTLDSSQSKPDALQTAQQGAPTGSGGGFGSLFTRPAGSWDCDTCLVQNKPEVVKCVACETAKPGTGVKPGLTLPPFSEPQTLPTPSSSNTAAVTTTTTTTQPSGFLGFGNLFKKPEGSWDCDTCMVENKAADTKCVSCQSPKPGAATPAPPSSASSTPVPSGGTLVGFGDKFKQPEGSWDCGVCLVQNTSEALQCVACQSNKPGVSAPPKGFGSSSSSSSSSSTSFTFGTQSTSSSTNSTATPSLGGFKFGSSSTDTASSDASSSSFKFSAPSGGFKFGTSSSPAAQSEDGKKDETQCVSGGFKFSVGGGIVFGISGVGSGPSNGESKVPTEGFSVGPPKPEENNSTAPMPAPTGFTFSVPKGKPEEAPAAQTTPAAPFSFGKPQETKSATEPPPPQGATDKDQGSSGQALAPTSAFMFGKSEEKQESAAPSSGFLFKPKEAEKLASSVGFSFSKPDPPKDQPKPAFTFGKPAEKPDSTEPPKPSFSFSATATDAGASKPTFGFMVGPTTTTTASSSSTSSTAPVPTLFGASSGSAAPPPAPAPAPSGTFLFRQGTPAEAAPTFVFGQQSDNQPFLFGAAANPAVPSFAFGATATPTVCTAASGPSPAPFVFSPAPSSSVAPAFGVGQAPAFGQGSGQPGAPAFGSSVPSLFSATASQPPAFGSQPSATPAPVFGQQANATPSFSSTAQGGSFQFGGAGAFGASGASGAAVFFGSTTGASATSTAPPSVPAQPSGSGGGFNFSQPPTFNIGSTKSSFMAPVPGQHSISGRKIKTAVRRRK